MGRKFGHDKQYFKISYHHEPLRLLHQSLENFFLSCLQVRVKGLRSSDDHKGRM